MSPGVHDRGSCVSPLSGVMDVCPDQVPAQAPQARSDLVAREAAMRACERGEQAAAAIETAMGG
jgi:hypothetical protein